jgi:radical SAM superfamily enzyme YgiQ (UPF0313 family)
VDYVGRIYRPPSEAYSLLLQVTTGCSHNRCTFCGMYRGQRFRTKPVEQVEADLAEAGDLGPLHRRAFLCDGDALILSTRRLLQVLELIRKHTPWIERVGIYGDTRSANRKSPQELRELRDAGLGIVYHGLESGDDEVLDRVVKGGTAAEAIETADLLRGADILHSVIVLLGIGGVELSAQHARNTATVLTRMDPPFVGALTTTVLPGTPLFDQQQAGTFELPGKFELLEELRTIVAEADLTNCRFSSNHASNYLPMRSVLPRDKPEILKILDEVLRVRDERLLKPDSMRGL